MPSFYGTELRLAPAARHGAVSLARDPRRGVPRLGGRRSSPSRCAARAAAAGPGEDFWAIVRELGVRVLPNTAGCHTVKEAVTTAQMAREVFGTPWIKLEVIGDARHAAARRVRAGRGGAHPRRRRLPGLPLHHRGPGRRRAAARRRLRGADALGRADRLGPRPDQPLRRCGRCARASPTCRW